MSDAAPPPQLLARLKPGCICRGIPMGRILDAIAAGAAHFEDIAARTGIGQGDCGGRRCRERVERLLSDLQKPAPGFPMEDT